MLLSEPKANFYLEIEKRWRISYKVLFPLASLCPAGTRLRLTPQRQSCHHLCLAFEESHLARH